MEKLIAMGLLMATSGSCFADAVMITSVTQFSVPVGKTITSVSGVEFNPGVSKIIFRIANKTCTFNSSGNPYGAGAGKGCTYALTVNNTTGLLSYPKSNGNGCTLARDMIAACK